MTQSAFAEWLPAIERVAAATRIVERVFVLAQIESTQQVARELGPRCGDLVVAWRQTDGRGRLGRRWIETGTTETGGDGIACTVVLPRGEPARLATMGALAMARAVEDAIPPKWLMGVKWPNDLVSVSSETGECRKFGGVLIEQVDDVALVGIGINVRQRAFEAPLDATATSLGLLGHDVDRLTLLIALVRAFDELQDVKSSALVKEFRLREFLWNTHRRVRMTDGVNVYDGVVLDIQPLRSIKLRLDDGRKVSIPVARAQLL